MGTDPRKEDFALLYVILILTEMSELTRRVCMYIYLRRRADLNRQNKTEKSKIEKRLKISSF